MSYFFHEESGLGRLEKQMQQQPGYRQRGKGLQVLDVMEWNTQEGYCSIVELVLSRLQMEELKSRVDSIFGRDVGEILYLDKEHRKRFERMLEGPHHRWLELHNNYAGAVYLLTVDEVLWEKTKGTVGIGCISFEQVRLGGVNLEQYILFQGAKDIYYYTQRIRLSELADRELVPDSLLKAYLNASVIRRFGLGR